MRYPIRLFTACIGLVLVSTCAFMAGANVGSVAAQAMIGFCGGFLVSLVVRRD